MTKLTKKVALSYAVATLTDTEFKTEFSKDEIVAKLTEMIEGLDKKSTGEKKLTEQQIANIGYKTDILAYLADGQAKTATEILKGIPHNRLVNSLIFVKLRQLLGKTNIVKELDRICMNARICAYFIKCVLNIDGMKLVNIVKKLQKRGEIIVVFKDSVSFKQLY